MSIDEAFVEHLTTEGYHPRSSKHSDFLSEIIIADLIENCPVLSEKAARGEVVVKLRHHQQVGYDDWVIDIAFGTCAGRPLPPEKGQKILFTAPAIIQIAIELKTVMTEHGKAQRNRLRDFSAFASHGHRYDPATVLGAFLAVNAAKCFYSPLRKDDDITTHGNKKADAREMAKATVDLFRSMDMRHSGSRAQGLDGIGVIVIEHDNLAVHPNPAAYTHIHKPTRTATIPPSPSIGDPIHYHAMIQRLCTAFTERFCSKS